jgi:hypothetical protein
LRTARPLVHVVLFWGGYLAILFLASMVKGMVPERWGQLVWGLLSAAALLPATLVLLSREGRSVRDVGLDLDGTSALRFFIGCLFGFMI